MILRFRPGSTRGGCRVGTRNVCHPNVRWLRCETKLLIDGSVHAGESGGTQLYLERLTAELSRLCSVGDRRTGKPPGHCDDYCEDAA
jgi:hypothetical protein